MDLHCPPARNMFVNLMHSCSIMFSLSTSSQHHTFPFVVSYLVHYILLQFNKIATVSQQVGLISSPAVD